MTLKNPVAYFLRSLVRNALKCSEKTRRITDVEAGLGDIFGNNCAGAYDSAIADHDWENGGICSDTYAIAKLGSAPKTPFLCGTTINEAIINEHSAVRNETVVPDGDEFADK
jgi:hypothetical protein